MSGSQADNFSGSNADPGVLRNDLAGRYYGLALHNAKQRNLGRAVVYARRSLALSTQDGSVQNGNAHSGNAQGSNAQGNTHADNVQNGNAHSGNARRLLGLCLFELGELDSAAATLEGFAGLTESVRQEREEQNLLFARVRELAARKRWRKAEVVLRAARHQSVRVLLTRGCLKASAKKYKEAARLFAGALEKDTGNSAAGAYLRSCCDNPKF